MSDQLPTASFSDAGNSAQRDFLKTAWQDPSSGAFLTPYEKRLKELVAAAGDSLFLINQAQAQAWREFNPAQNQQNFGSEGPGEDRAAIEAERNAAYAITIARQAAADAEFAAETARRNTKQNQAQQTGSQGSISSSVSVGSGSTSASSTTSPSSDSASPTGATPTTRIGQLLRNPQRLRDALEFVELLMEAQILVTLPNSTRGISSLAISAQNIVFPVPLKIAVPIADSTSTAASVSTQLNLLLAALRVTGQLPT